MLWVIICAAGSGSRVGGTPKQYRDLLGMSVLARSVTAMALPGASIVIATNDREAALASGVAPGRSGVVAIIDGGEQRRDSVGAALEVVPGDATAIAVHDAVRPLATSVLVDRGLETLRDGADGAVPAVAISDTVKRVDKAGVVQETIDRGALMRVQTPQLFVPEVLRHAHREFSGTATDDAAMVEGMGAKVVTFAGDPDNIKITHEHDFATAAAILDRRTREQGGGQ